MKIEKVIEVAKAQNLNCVIGFEEVYPIEDILIQNPSYAMLDFVITLDGKVRSITGGSSFTLGMF